MPKRTDIKTVLVIGAGPIIIGQACEFDYSGTQACKALREEGYRVVLINSNPATIMTDPGTADAVYIEPLTPESVEKIIIAEKPDVILPTVGGQTALNLALKIWRMGILEKYGVELIGACPESIDKAEDRRLFNKAMDSIGLQVPRNTIVKSMDEAMEALQSIGLPAVIRPSFTLGGTGGGIANTEQEYRDIIAYGLEASPVHEVQVDQSLLGWKEYEMEVVRDCADNAIIVCSIENVDPMGVHTGDSITVAPALTLTDKEYQYMRDASVAVLREIGIDTGGSNVQFAVNPANGDMVVIEMNPRVSRSSALASKATGFPIAKVAAKLAIGYRLDEIDNDITRVTPASFEPTIDYVVTKIPRFTFEKFGMTNPELSSTMRSVGEAMSMGRTFAESLQKGLRSMETGLTGLNTPGRIAGFRPQDGLTQANRQALLAALKPLASDRILRIGEALRHGLSVEEIHEITSYDPWFLRELEKIVQQEQKIIADGLPTDAQSLRDLKQMGFSDARLAELSGKTEKQLRDLRHKLNVRPVYKMVDTCASEFASTTPYMYSCYEQTALTNLECSEALPSGRKKVVVLGGGPNRIGQGIEFDYACVHACFTLREMGVESIMINCNPETVSTDYDTSDRLYFEPLTAEDVIEVIDREMQSGHLLGVVVQFGGQTPLKLSKYLAEHNIPVVGTSPDSIDLAEDRDRFQRLVTELALRQPESDICFKVSEIGKAIEKVGFPCVIRPSNVLGGRAMDILHDESQLAEYLEENQSFLLDGSILVDRFLEKAIELDVDALCDGEQVWVAGIMEHIEEAGIHSGDSACVLPPFSLSQDMVEQVRESTRKLALALKVKGLINVQYAIKDDVLYIIEANPRASRTVPFVAKATGRNIANIGTRLMLGQSLQDFNLTEHDKLPCYAVKESVFPFARFANADTLLGPEMKSTGEVMGIDTELPLAFAKAQIAAGNIVPLEGNVLFSVCDRDKPLCAPLALRLEEMGFKIMATQNTANFLRQAGVKQISELKKEHEEGYNTLEAIRSGDVQLMINSSDTRLAVRRSYHLRRTVFMSKVPYVTTMRAAQAIVDAITDMRRVDNDLSVRSLQMVSVA